MTEESGQDLIAALTEDLTPTSPIPPLRKVVAGVLLLWLAIAVVLLLVLGVRPEIVQALSTPFASGGIFAGLCAAGLGGLIAALALSVPGREATVRAGFAIAGVGLAYAAGVGTFLFVQSPAITWTGSFGADFQCLAVAVIVALVPALGVIAFSARAQVFRPMALVLAAAVGTAALGAVTSQAHCPTEDARHLMLGHILAPGFGALVLSLPLLVALRRSSRA